MMLKYPALTIVWLSLSGSMLRLSAYPPPPPPPPPQILSVSLLPAKKGVYQGQSGVLSLSTNANSAVTVTLQSSDDSLVRLATGTVQVSAATSPIEVPFASSSSSVGTATITATTAGGIAATSQVVVSRNPLAGHGPSTAPQILQAFFDQSTIVIPPGQTSASLQLSDNSTSEASISLVSSDPTVAFFDNHQGTKSLMLSAADGPVTINISAGAKSGTAVITAGINGSAGGTGIQAVCQILVPISFSISPGGAQLQALGNSGAATLSTNSAGPLTVSLTSDNPAIARPASATVNVPAQGSAAFMVTPGAAAGSTFVRAGIQGFAGAAALSVSVSLPSLVFSPSNLSATVGASAQTAHLSTNSQTGFSVALGSANGNIAAPQNSPIALPAQGGKDIGINFGGAVGTTTITATATNNPAVTATLSVDVTAPAPIVKPPVQGPLPSAHNQWAYTAVGSNLAGAAVTLTLGQGPNTIVASLSTSAGANANTTLFFFIPFDQSGKLFLNGQEIQGVTPQTGTVVISNSGGRTPPLPIAVPQFAPGTGP